MNPALFERLSKTELRIPRAYPVPAGESKVLYFYAIFSRDIVYSVFCEKHKVLGPIQNKTLYKQNIGKA